MNTFTISIYRANTSTLISLEVLRHFQLFFQVLRFRLLCVHFLIKIVQPIGKQRVPGVIQLLSESTYTQTHTETPTRTHTQTQPHALWSPGLCMQKSRQCFLQRAAPLPSFSLSLCVSCLSVLVCCLCVCLCSLLPLVQNPQNALCGCPSLLLFVVVALIVVFVSILPLFSVCVCIFASFLRFPGFFTVGFADCLISNSF